MTEISNVNGLDVRAGMKLRHPRAGVLTVEGAARQKSGSHVTNRVTVVNSAGKRGVLTFTERDTFTVIQ